MNSFVTSSGPRAVAFSRKAAVVVIGAATFSLVSLGAAASSDPTRQIPSRQSVDFRDLDLSKSDDAKRLYRRLRAASQDVCGVLDRSPAARPNPRNECAATALNNAVAEVDHPSLTALHTAKTQLRVAQRTKGGSAKS